MMTALFAARNIMGAEYDLWAVNTEPEYHEEQQERPATVAEAEPRRPAYAEPPLVPGSSPGRSAGQGSPVAGEAKAAKAAIEGGLSTP